MAYHDGHSPSAGSKTALLLFTLTGTVFSAIMLLKNGRFFLFRDGLLLTCAVIFYLRLAICLLVFVKRKISWFEGCSVGILYGFLVYMFSLWGSSGSENVNFYSIAGVLFFIAGSWINSQSDYQRYVWKKKPGNAGRLYTKGLFRYAMHINFFGDSIMFVGYALITRNAMSIIPVLFIILNFIFIQIPKLDHHLKNKYGDDFDKYAGKTGKYIPFIY